MSEISDIRSIMEQKTTKGVTASADNFTEYEVKPLHSNYAKAFSLTEETVVEEDKPILLTEEDLYLASKFNNLLKLRNNGLYKLQEQFRPGTELWELLGKMGNNPAILEDINRKLRASSDAIFSVTSKLEETSNKKGK